MAFYEKNVFSLYTNILIFSICDMKKARIFLASLFVMAIIGLAVNIHFSVGQKPQSVDMKNNVEALADGEGSGSTMCLYPGTVACPGDTDIKVRYVISRTLEK